ncbi:MAG: hypothetical protein FWG33_01425 [Oscillospiraceae bacterium]|nr:hypothetical protein [Oscillospiraceae bacterium]
MQITTKIILDMLTRDSVSVVSQKYIEIEGVEQVVGDNVRCAFSNSKHSREKIKEYLKEHSDCVNAVFAVWTDNPTINDELEKAGDES